jgi:hypothetical protein
MKTIFKYSSKLIDYFWFWSFLTFIVDIYDFDLFASIFVTLLTPILFIPVETLLVWGFQTTLGKYITHQSYSQKLKFKDSLLIALRNGFFLKAKIQPTYKESSKKKHLVAILASIIISLACTFPDSALNLTSKALPFKFFQELKVKRNGGGNCPDGWVKLAGEENSPFLIFFPSKPKLEEIIKAVPHSDFLLNYKEYSYDKYSLGHVDLPRSWTKWGSNLVFKGSLQQVIKNENGNIIEKKKTIHEKYPALDYKIQRGEITTTGRLILVNNTLYKLEVKETSSDSQNQTFFSDLFFNAFHLVRET